MISLMGILLKHKKVGAEGMKDFVCNLENTAPVARKNIIQMAMLEDPVYMRWVIMNILDVESLFNLTPDDFERVVDTLPTPAKTLVLAFYLSPLEDRFIEAMLPGKYKQQYTEECEFMIDFTREQHHMARRQLVSKMRQLQRARDIQDFTWRLPGNDILAGEHIKTPSKGPYELKFENGKPALIGQYEKKLREGIWRHFYPEGKLLAEGIYISEVKEGEWAFFYESGAPQSRGQYKEDSRIGDWEFWTPEGERTVTSFDK